MSDWRNLIQRPVKHLAEQLRGIRPGALSVGFLETFRVHDQGNSWPLVRIAAIANQGGRFVITPFDKAQVGKIVKSLADAKLNAYALNPSTVGVAVPPPSGEQKTEMAKHVKKLGEEAKVAVRAVRQATRKEFAARGRGSERAVQEATDTAVEEIERLIKAKLAELEK